MEAFMTIEELHRTVVDGFRKSDERFTRIDERFVGIDERFDRVDERFDRVDAEFVKVREEMREFHTAVEARIREEHETTRRHFDVMVEKVEAAVRIVAEGHATFAP
jgi:archaellum component FlaC